jgi:hypothetical protein
MGLTQKGPLQKSVIRGGGITGAVNHAIKLKSCSEVPSITHPLGLPGGGEGEISPSLDGIRNAIVVALAAFGVDHIEIPATSENVWRAVRDSISQS